MPLVQLTRYVWLNAMAIVFSLSSVLIDRHIGLVGTSSFHVSPLQAILVLLTGLLYAWWGLSLAAAGKSGILSSFFLVFGWSFLANGVLPIPFSGFPAPHAFPYADTFHIGNMVFGGMASFSTARAVRSDKGSMSWGMAVISVALVVATLSFTGILYFSMLAQL